ncbi:hypothetical protein [Paratractidigestivibacter faecalis]|uniref:hypothetical protein n=1 Tax=Paratractidigestivibacter faecalis TaxID=2292441 RepID=UPI000E3EA941|nr:hypothetical protein [Paratractidigestivibacter faecalis]
MSEKTAAAPAGALTCARRRLCVALLVLLGFSLVVLTLWFARREGIRGQAGLRSAAWGAVDLRCLGPNLTLVTLQIDGTLQARSTRRGIVAFPATRPKETP